MVRAGADCSSIDSRGGGGPAWSPDGTKMAAIYEGVLAGVAGVAATGEPLGPPRRVTTESAHSPSWAGRLAAHPLSVARQAADRRHRNRRDAHGAARSEVDAGGADRPHRRPRRQAGRHEERRRRAPTSTSSSTATGSRSVVAARRRATTPAAGGRRVEPDGDAGADRVPLASAAGLRRVAGPRVAGVRHHHGAQPGQHAVRSGRGARSERGRRASRPARLRHRLPDGVAARLLQDGHRDLERRAVRDGAAARQGAAARSDQELRPAARPAAEADGRVRAQHRRSGRDARDLSGGARRRRQHRAHRRDQPPRLLAEDGDAAAQPTRTCAAVRQERADLLPDDFGRRRAPAVRARAGPEERSALQAVSGVDAGAGRGAAGGRASPAAAAIRPAAAARWCSTSCAPAA